MNLTDVIARYKDLHQQRRSLAQEIEQHFVALREEQTIIHDLQMRQFAVDNAFGVAADDLHEALTGERLDRMAGSSMAVMGLPVEIDESMSENAITFKRHR